VPCYAAPMRLSFVALAYALAAAEGCASPDGWLGYPTPYPDPQPAKSQIPPGYHQSGPCYVPDKFAPGACDCRRWTNSAPCIRSCDVVGKQTYARAFCVDGGVEAPSDGG